MSSSGTAKNENLKADIVVIGGGGAGLAAAAAAAEKGARNVVVVEKRRAPGGNAIFAGGLFATERQLQKGLDINALRDDFFKKAMNYAHWKTNPRLVRALIDKSDDTIRWLEEKGMNFEQMIPPSLNQLSPRPMNFPLRIGPLRRKGAEVVKALIKYCEDQGVQFLCQTRAKKLLTSEKGKVSGVLAEAKDKEIRITAKSVVIATGGFAGNKKLLKKYLPPYEEGFYLKGLPHTGDGLLMATEIGAAIDGMAVLEMDGPDFPWASYWYPRITMNCNAIWVNKKGERFTDESVVNLFESANSLYRQPGKTSYTLFDENIKQSIFKEEPNPMRERHAGSKSSLATKVDKDLRLQADKGRVKISDSWDEIAKWIGVAPQVLKATIDEYNSFCDKGHDDTFAKDPSCLLPLRTPPYYAIRCCLSLLVTHGGPKINHHMEVLDKQDNPIPGLYAAGVETGSTDANTYNSALPGHSFGFSVNSGRIAGENAVKFIKGK